MAYRTGGQARWRARSAALLAGFFMAAAVAGSPVKQATSVSKSRAVAAVTGRSVAIHVRGATGPAYRIIVVNRSGLDVTLHGWSPEDRPLPSGGSSEFACDDAAAGGVVEIDDGLYRHPHFVETTCGDVVTLR